MKPTLLIAGLGNPVLADFVAHAQGRYRLVVVSTSRLCREVKRYAETYPANTFARDGFRSAYQGEVFSLVVFLGRRLTTTEQNLLDTLAEIARQQPAIRVGVISTFRVHCGDGAAARVEAYLRNRLQSIGVKALLFRPGHVLSGRSRVRQWLRSLAFCHPLVPERFQSCFLTGDELFCVLERELEDPKPRPSRTFTLLGRNRSWKAILRENQNRSLGQRVLTAAAMVLSLLQVGRVLGLFFDLLARVVPRLRAWNFDTLIPRGPRELLALYNPYNFPYVKIVGYNNGVVHFGQRFPDKTVVSTVRCHRVARVQGQTATFDAGVTIRQAMDVLGRAGKELHVLPNYSYVSLGTSFFVPIHGSAAEYSTLGDTIEKVVLYDPAEDRLLVADRKKEPFRQHLYNLKSDVLLLRLTLRVKEKTRYFVQRQTLASPTSAELLAAFHDPMPSHVEVRKGKAASRTVEVCRYYTGIPPSNTSTLEVPRDALGRLWDLIEANPLSRVLFHGLMRRYGYHVELFFNADEFAVFWDTHGRLPLAKIQLRYIRRDGFPHSPFREHDCISADLFLLKKHQEAFERYVKETFRAVQFNPGKHSL